MAQLVSLVNDKYSIQQNGAEVIVCNFSAQVDEQFGFIHITIQPYDINLFKQHMAEVKLQKQKFDEAVKQKAISSGWNIF